jgi:hypothetical protein
LLIFYLQLIGAFDTLHGFAVGEETENLEVAPRTGWAAEAAGWTKTYEKVTGKSIDEDVQEPSNDPLKFWIFSNACVSPKKWLEAPTNEDDSYRIYLSDSSRTRKDVLEHIFKPLLGDVFAFNVVQQTFESLGIKRDYQYLLKVSNTVDTSRFFNDSKAGPDPEVPLKALHHFCRDSTNLVQAFWLATVCRDAVAQAAKQKEEKTYGKISSTEAGKYTLEFLVILDGCCVAYTRLTVFAAFTIIIQSASGTSYCDNFESVCWYLSV